MWISKQDFQIRAESFRLNEPMNILRILCGLFFLPHALGKFAAGGLNPDTVGFFAQAGFAPAAAWVALAAVSELLVGVALIAGIATRFSALAAAAVLLVAAYALGQVVGFKWFWGGSGMEYLIFWMSACLLVAQHAFLRHKRT
ncbi:putative oxidoreductase [Neisseria sp. HSC-16F19]|nr:DoxX family membrane protein [Neisseria sp. HSC-16F19]MCP2041556.1 putative oxidoreductase [Neisseria sp. HSC-16F19]